MGRPRKHNPELPPCVYLRRGKFYHVQKGKWTLIGGERDLDGFKAQANAEQGSMVWLIREAVADILVRPSLKTGKPLSAATKAQYKVAGKKLEYAFAEFNPEEIDTVNVKGFMRLLRDTPNMANRCLSLLRLIFEYGMDFGVCRNNPARGATQLRENHRDRLLSVAEFEQIRAHAVPRLQAMMDIWRITGQRVMDVAKIKRADLTPDGIAFRQQKTGAKLIVAWTPELKEAVDRAKSLSGMFSSLTLFSTRKGPNRGSSPAHKTIYLQWVAACKRAGVEDAQMRDLRAVAGTEAEAQGLNPTALLGHTSPEMTRRYLRGKKVPVVAGPSFGRVLDIGREPKKSSSGQ